MITIQDWLSQLSNVSEEEMSLIYEITETTRLKANELILQQGTISSRIGLLMTGATRTVYTDVEGNEKVISFNFEGDPLIVVDSFLNKSPSPVSSYTLEPSVILWTDYEGFDLFMKRFPRYHTIMVAALAQWFAGNKDRLEYLHLSSAKARYERMCQLHPKIIERVPLMYIASYLGITQQTLSRVRAKKL